MAELMVVSLVAKMAACWGKMKALMWDGEMVE